MQSIRDFIFKNDIIALVFQYLIHSMILDTFAPSDGISMKADIDIYYILAL